MPDQISSLFKTYKDKTLSINKKRFQIKKQHSIFNFRKSIQYEMNKRKSVGNLKLNTIQSSIINLKKEIETENAQNQNNKKRLKLMRFIAGSRKRSDIGNKSIGKREEKKDYFKSYINFVGKIKKRKAKSIDRVSDIEKKIQEKKTQIKKIEEEIGKNKKKFLDLKFKKNFYDKLKKKNKVLKEKGRKLNELMDEENVLHLKHNMFLENEQVQKEKLNDEIALFIIQEQSRTRNKLISKLIFEATILSSKLRNKK